MSERAVLAAMHDDDAALLAVARDWKAGRLRPMHSTIARQLNRVLVASGEAPVPFARATDPDARSFAELIRAEHERAGDRRSPAREAA